MFVDESSKKVHFTRRSLLESMGAGVAMAVGSSFGGSSIAEAATVVSARTFAKGADVSWLPQMEAHGYRFYNNEGREEDCLEILKRFGVNAIRLRTWVNPSNDPIGGHCSIYETVAMALRCKRAGLPVDLDFHFGDSWTSVGSQNPPAAWAHLSYYELSHVLGRYVQHCMDVFRYYHVEPGWVQIGNEINSGICHSVGSIENPAQMTGLLMAARAEVKHVFPNVPVLIHLAQPQKSASIVNFYNAYVAHGGEWDISAFSSYGSGDEIPGILSNIAGYQRRFGKPVMQVEFGGKVTNPGGTRASLEAYVRGIRDMGGLGVFFWEPEVYAPFDSYNGGAWSSNSRQPTAALQGFAV